MTLAVDLCIDWQRVGEMTGGTFDGVVRDLAAGQWTLSGQVENVELEGGVTLADVNTIRVLDDTLPIFGGFVRPISAGVGGLSRSDVGDGETFTLAGPDLWAIPASRLAWPTPSTTPPWADGHDERAGVASTVAAGYLSANLGSTAIADRQIPGVTITDGLAGTAGEWSARLQPLDQLIARICADGAITCRLNVDLIGVVTIVLGPPRDRTATIVLSDQADLSAIQLANVAATANWVVAGGQGELSARTFAVAGTATGLARIESFYDVSALASALEVQQAATSRLGQSAATFTVNALLADFAGCKLAYRTDYEVGDTIAVEIDGVRHPLKVVAVTIHHGPDRSVVKPVFGARIVNRLQGLIADVASLTTRLDSTIA